MEQNNAVKIKLRKVNLSTVFFLVLSLVSTTFAWFAYSNIIKSDINIEIKSWGIDMTENGTEASQLVSINIDNFSPGVETYTRDIRIQNNGDIPAYLKYEIVSLRILDITYNIDNQADLFDQLAHNYPFFINFSLNTNYLETNEFATFKMSIGWPLDSEDNSIDTTLGMDAYNFYEGEKARKQANPNYTERPCISLIIKLISEQYVPEENLDISDNRYRYSNVGILDDLYCMLDKDNKLSDSGYTIITRGRPGGYQFSELQSNAVSAEEIIDLVSTDINNTYIVNNNYSKRILGTINNQLRLNNIIYELKRTNSKVEFSQETFVCLYNYNRMNCVWTGTSIDNNYAFAMKVENDKSYIYKELKTTTCNELTKQVMSK